MIKNVGCLSNHENKFCPCARTYTEQQQESNKLCTNPDCGHYMGNHSEKIAQQSHYDRTGMKITILIYL